ncbi:MAG: putative metal-binding motif-containing protein, partial [Myxococcales bacterium]|nr:putative metal-binding motif-containing protein [Myxococcales bacterium]
MARGRQHHSLVPRVRSAAGAPHGVSNGRLPWRRRHVVHRRRPDRDLRGVHPMKTEWTVAMALVVGIAGCRNSIAPGSTWADADEDGVAAWADCDDLDAAVGEPRLWYPDGDEDGFVAADDPVYSCQPPSPAASDVASPRDCNDTDASIHGPSWLFADADRDGFGDPDRKVWACLGSGAQSAGDCDDRDQLVNPNIAEMCDGVDNDCNEVVDDGAVCDLAPWTGLAFAIAEAAVDDVHDRLVVSSVDARALLIRDLATQADLQVDLPMVPDALSVAPDGGTAVVGHAGWVSEVDVLSGAVLETWPTGVPGGAVVHGGDRAFVFAQDVEHAQIQVELATGDFSVATQEEIREGAMALHPSGLTIYGATRDFATPELLRFDVRSYGLRYASTQEKWSWPAH